MHAEQFCATKFQAIKSGYKIFNDRLEKQTKPINSRTEFFFFCSFVLSADVAVLNAIHFEIKSSLD